MMTLQESQNITVSLSSYSNSNFEFTRCYFSESVSFYISTEYCMEYSWTLTSGRLI